MSENTAERNTICEKPLLEQISEKTKAGREAALAYLRRQESAETTTLLGPTSSAKSTVIAELLPPQGNRLLGRNIGDVAQTSKFTTRLMLNARLNQDEAVVQCIPYQNDLTGSAYQYNLTNNLLDVIKQELGEAIYDARDDLEEFTVNEELIRRILDPAQRQYHTWRFAQEAGLTESLTELLNKACAEIIEHPEHIKRAAAVLFQNTKEKRKGFKRKHAYQQLVDERLSENHESIRKITDWLGELVKSILLKLNSYWTHEDLFLTAGTTEPGGNIDKLVDFLYSEGSPCSLIFREVVFSTAPSAELQEKYRARFQGRPCRLNFVDTVGLTQSSQEEEVIRENIDRIVRQDTDAFLFLCAADEQPMVYEYCIRALLDNAKQIHGRPVLLCRSKADQVIRNIMVNNYRRATGSTRLGPEDETYAEYLTGAHQAFLDEFINSDAYGEKKLGRIGYISIAPDLTSAMDPHLNGALNPARVHDYLLDLVQQVDEMYAADRGTRLWLESADVLHYPLEIQSTAEALSITIAHAMVQMNSAEGGQYLSYSKVPGRYHGRSVNGFRTRLPDGMGYVTRAAVYLNFRIFLTNMVAKWLREMVPQQDLLNNLEVSFKYLKENAQSQEAMQTIPAEFKKRLEDQWEAVTQKVATRLSYHCFKDDFERAFLYQSWDAGFRRSLQVIHEKFSSVAYWNENIIPEFERESEAILNKLYIYI